MNNTVSLSTSKALTLAFAVGLLVGGVAGYSLNSFVGADVSNPPADGQSPGDERPPQGNQLPEKPSDNLGANEVKTSALDTKGDPVLGAQDAPVVIAYWSDYQCSYCRRFELEILPKIVSNYVKKGKVKIVFKDLPVVSRRSRSVALLGQSAWIQARGSKGGRWWDWHHEVFARQSNHKAPPRDVLLKMLENRGIAPKPVTSRLENKLKSVRSEIKDDMGQAKVAKIDGTPGFVIYGSGDAVGTRIVGAQPFSKFKSAIESELSEEKS